MHSKVLKYEISEGMAYLILNNPPANVMSAAFFDALSEICEKHIIKEDYKGLIIKSTGRHFSSGANVEELLDLFKNESNNAENKTLIKNTEAFIVLQKISKPVVALLSGICYGSALELALCAKYRWASTNAVLSLPETSFGLMPGLGGINNVFYKAGFAQTLELTLTSKTIFAQEALAMGLVDKITDKKIIEAQAVEFIQTYADKT